MAEATDTLLEEAIEALRQDDTARAKEILTRLIRANQTNATYWIWMSAAVDTVKERIYCLETALKLDPENASAKRGLLLMGARPIDPNVKPFPLNRTRAWEEKIFLAQEGPLETGWRGVLSNPVIRLATTVLAGAVLLAAVVVAAFNPGTSIFRDGAFVRPGPSPTYTATPTFLNAADLEAATPGSPTPLALLLGISYTPTPLYVNTPRSPIAADSYRAALAAYAQGDWEEFVRQMQQVQKDEPQAADIQYQIAEGYRLRGECSKAFFYYNESLKVDKAFAPGYLGLARARLCMDPGANTTQLYDLAQQADPAYGEVYLERANFNLRRKDFKAALRDLELAGRLMPNSALVQLGFAEAYLLQGNPARALSAARRANTIDLTLLPSYYYLGSAYVENEQYAEAIKPLQLYLMYETQESSAFALLGEALAKTENYRAAVEALNKGLQLDPNQGRSFVYLGVSYLRLGNLAGAEVNFRRAIEDFPDSFDANIGLTEIFYRKGTYGTAYLQAETAFSKAANDTEQALAIYWRALAHEGRKSFGDAIKDWKTLLSMPVSAMTAQMRTDAQEHLRTVVPPTSTARPPGATPTLTPSPTNRPGMTATPAPPTAVKTRTPTRTRTPTKTP